VKSVPVKEAAVIRNILVAVRDEAAQLVVAESDNLLACNLRLTQ
jgi:hypothetical protein